ncbi:hypothetical protein B0H16DRAFT_1699386 [Mycena metata]|uniref:Uncharacterized protein n=1 Tax=Mycena metata TaxID=1033252 RepID=A0AAD7ML28_9AGAR|nr:hypothetical protein B0H16DRAFT_1699386 [Mycena metata]
MNHSQRAYSDGCARGVQVTGTAHFAEAAGVREYTALPSLPLPPIVIVRVLRVPGSGSREGSRLARLNVARDIAKEGPAILRVGVHCRDWVDEQGYHPERWYIHCHSSLPALGVCCASRFGSAIGTGGKSEPRDIEEGGKRCWRVKVLVTRGEASGRLVTSICGSEGEGSVFLSVGGPAGGPGKYPGGEADRATHRTADLQTPAIHAHNLGINCGSTHAIGVLVPPWFYAV